MCFSFFVFCWCDVIYCLYFCGCSELSWVACSVAECILTLEILHLFSQMVWVVPVPVESARAAGQSWSQADDEVGGIGQ